MQKHINGWQRLWVVLVVLYLVPVIASTLGKWPTEYKFNDAMILECIESAARHSESTTPGLTYEKARAELMWDYYGSFDSKPDIWAIEGIRSAYGDKANIVEIQDKYIDKIVNIRTEQAKVFGVAVLWWLIPSALLYLIGLVIAWVIQGFRSDHPS
jgi:hypothetical protein